MTQILASSKLETFDLKGELDELAPLIKNGLYKKFNFEGALDTYVNLKECNILLLMRQSSSGIRNDLESLCNNVTFKDIRNETDFFVNMTVEYAKQYDLIVLDSNVWTIYDHDARKSIELTDQGIPCLLIGNDTNGSYYGTGCQSLSVTDDSDLKTSYIISDNIGFNMETYNYTNLSDGLCYPTRFSNDKMFPLLKCKQYYPMIAYQSPCNTISVMDYTAGLTLNKDFMVKLIEWLLSTKKHIQFDDAILFNDGIVCQEPYKNLWTRYANGIFSSSPANGNWSVVTDFPYGVIDEFGENPKIIKCEPKKGMNYYTIKSSSDLQNYPDSQYPSGTKYRVSCWAYVEENCDMSAKYVRIMGEAPTNGGPQGYDFNKKGTWQYLSGIITSNSAGFYFLLYANTGYENIWTKGNVYYANIQISKAPNNEERRYMDSAKSSSWNHIDINNINSSTNFTLIYEYNQLLNYSGNLPDYAGKEIMYVNSKGKNLRIGDWYAPNSGSNPLVGFDEFVTSQQESWWHFHIGMVLKNTGDKHYIILRKQNNEFNWYFTKNTEIFKSSVINISKYPELANFNISNVVIKAAHGGLAKSLTIYNRALDFDEITKLIKVNKYMNITLDGDLITNKLTEQQWLPDNCFYSSLAEDSCKNFIKTPGDIIHVDDWAYSGNVKNYLGRNCIVPNGSDLVTCVYDENENEYTIHVPKNDNMLWYQKGVRLNSISVEGNERYAMCFEFYCDVDLNISIDLNNTASGIASNDNHESTAYGNTSKIQKGGKYNSIYIIYDLLNNSPSFSCTNTIYIDSTQAIPPQGITFKIKNIRLHKIIGGKANNFKNRYYPWSDRDTYAKNLKFNLYEDIGFKWNEPWTICYMKKPIATNKDSGNNNERGGYLIDSIGCNNNSVGGGYHWFGKFTGTTNGISISGGTGKNYNPEDFYYKQQMWVLRYENGRMTLNIYLENGTRLDSVLDTTISTPNKLVTQHGYDLLLGGWDDGAICQAYYKDLIVAQRCLTEQELLKIFKARIIDEPNNTNILGLLNEGGI